MGIDRQMHGIVMWWLGYVAMAAFWASSAWHPGWIALGVLLLMAAGVVSYVDGRES